MAEPFTVLRSLSRDGTRLVIIDTKSNERRSRSEIEARKQKLHPEVLVTFNTGLFDCTGDEIFIGDIITRADKPGGKEYLVRANGDEDDFQFTKPFFIDMTVYADEDTDRREPVRFRKTLTRADSVRFRIVNNVYHASERMYL